MKRRMHISILSLILVICGCSRYADISSEQEALLKTDQAWAAAAEAGDPERILTFWADDAINYFPGFPPAEGKAAIAELVKRNRSKPGFSLSWKPVKAVVGAAGNLGYT
ncbi:MAG TPA: nuclear transport factor 2 family protein, partial [Verrucomicrobiae bacterium]|nr:nuclear transport factor 2 family protein [Verrucomicrobiae bacterium]